MEAGTRKKNECIKNFQLINRKWRYFNNDKNLINKDNGHKKIIKLIKNCHFYDKEFASY